MKVTTEGRAFATPGQAVDAVSGVVHRPTRLRRPAFLLVHGAGGDLDDAGLVALCDAIAEQGHLVVRANLPYREAGRKAPPRADRAVAGYRTLVESVRELAPRTPWVFGGKSYGGRVASLAVAAGLPAAGLVFYGYPLHPPGKPDQLRVDHWPHVPGPCLFLQGDRDTFGSVELFERNFRRLPRRARLHVVPGGDHSLKVTGRHAPDRRARAAADVTRELGPLVEDWVRDTIA